jgi:hypothetical protein
VEKRVMLPPQTTLILQIITDKLSQFGKCLKTFVADFFCRSVRISIFALRVSNRRVANKKEQIRLKTYEIIFSLRHIALFLNQLSGHYGAYGQHW